MLGGSKTSKYTLSSNEYRLRTHSSTVALMSLYVSTGEEIYGVTGVSPLIGFKDFDLIRGFVIDYLHCVLSGMIYLTKFCSKSNLIFLRCSLFAVTSVV